MEDTMNKAIATIGISFMLILIYMGWVVTTYKPEIIQNTTGPLPKKETRSNYELPELSEEEQAVTDSLIKHTVKQAEIESERKSVESMRNEVIKILDEAVEEDSTITVSFNMQWTPSWVD
jgi:hypothetical protein